MRPRKCIDTVGENKRERGRICKQRGIEKEKLLYRYPFILFRSVSPSKVEADNSSSPTGHNSLFASSITSCIAKQDCDTQSVINFRFLPLIRSKTKDKIDRKFGNLLNERESSNTTLYNILYSPL